MIRWLYDICYVVFRYWQFRKDQEWAARELARLKLLAESRIIIEAQQIGTEGWDTIIDTDCESTYHIARYLENGRFTTTFAVRLPMVIRLRVDSTPAALRNGMYVPRETVTDNG